MNLKQTSRKEISTV